MPRENEGGDDVRDRNRTDELMCSRRVRRERTTCVRRQRTLRIYRAGGLDDAARLSEADRPVAFAAAARAQDDFVAIL